MRLNAKTIWMLLFDLMSIVFIWMIVPPCQKAGMTLCTNTSVKCSIIISIIFFVDLVKSWITPRTFRMILLMIKALLCIGIPFVIQYYGGCKKMDMPCQMYTFPALYIIFIILLFTGLIEFIYLVKNKK